MRAAWLLCLRPFYDLSMLTSKKFSRAARRPLPHRVVFLPRVSNGWSFTRANIIREGPAGNEKQSLSRLAMTLSCQNGASLI